jgi:hypothetical protein
MSDTNIIEFRKPVPPAQPASGTGGYRLGGTQGNPNIEREQQLFIDGSSARIPIEIDKLYPADKNYGSDLIAALGILADAAELLEQAKVTRNKDVVQADRYWQRFQVLLPALFTRRKIGDGYGAVINALHVACINLHGIPPTSDQITTVWRVVKALRSAPVIRFEEALKYVEELEESRLEIYPKTISELIEDQEEDQEETDGDE